MLAFGQQAQLGILCFIVLAAGLGFEIKGKQYWNYWNALDGLTSIYVANRFAPNLLGAISVAALILI